MTCQTCGIAEFNTGKLRLLVKQLQVKLAESEAKVNELEGMLEISERTGKRDAEWGIATKEHLFAAQAELVELRKTPLDYDYDAHLERYGATTKNPQEPVAYVKYEMGKSPMFIPVIAGKVNGTVFDCEPLYKHAAPVPSPDDNRDARGSVAAMDAAMDAAWAAARGATAARDAAWVAWAAALAAAGTAAWAAARDADRLDYLALELVREQEAIQAGLPIPSSLFRMTNPITREAIDQAMNTKGE